MFAQSKVYQKGDQNDQGWQAVLQQQSHLLNKALLQKVAYLHEEVKDATRFGSEKCWKCGKRRHLIDVVQFECHPEKRTQVKYEPEYKKPHFFCHRCLDYQFADQSKYLNAIIHKDSDTHEAASDKEQAKFLKLLSEKGVRILPCPECKTPNVLKQETKFSESIYRQKSIDAAGTMSVYYNHRETTFKLIDNFVVEKVYENQRRPMFGSFSADNLLITDWGGHYSDAFLAEVEHPLSTPPNKAWFWIESYSPDIARKDVDDRGWQYGPLSFKSSNFNGRVSMFDFVRRRRLLHTRVRLSQEVCAMLESLAGGLPKESEKEAQRSAVAKRNSRAFSRMIDAEGFDPYSPREGE